jgi:hypothetical protein
MHYSDGSAMNEWVHALLWCHFVRRQAQAASWMRERLRAPFGASLHKLLDEPEFENLTIVDVDDFLDFSSVSEVARNLLFVLEKGPAERVVGAKRAPQSNSMTLIVNRNRQVMVSYRWKQKPLIIRLVVELELLGFVVWRDEVGTEYAPALHGNTAAAMAAAIE